MTSESKLVVELWDYFRDLLPARHRAEAALHVLRLFEEYGIEIKKSDIEGEDDYLDDALNTLHDDHEHDHDDYNGYNDRD